MIYHIHELLLKLGAPEVREKNSMSWHYFAPQTRDIAGRAHIRFEMAGEVLVAEIHGLDSEGAEKQDAYFCLAAERTARPDHYRVVKMIFDGATYDRPSKAVTELGASIFHARALDISIRMVEQSFNKDDLLQSAEEAAPVQKLKTPPRFQTFVAEKPATPVSGVVVPFRPRQSPAALRA